MTEEDKSLYVVPAAVQAAEPAPAVEAVVSKVNKLTKLKNKNCELEEQIKIMKKQLKESIKENKNIIKIHKKEMKEINAPKKRKGNSHPCGLEKPTLISDELANFLGKPHGTEMPRIEVTKVINAYIRDNKLQDSTDGRKIIPDAKLTALLKLDETIELTYFNLQTYLAPHYPKTVAVSEVSNDEVSNAEDVAVSEVSNAEDVNVSEEADADADADADANAEEADADAGTDV